MKICLNTNQWLDGEGRPLSSGRISVFVHGTNVPMDIFTLDVSYTYSQAENPFILDESGRAPTVWFDAATVDVRVEAWNGVTGSYDLVDTYQDGFTLPSTKNDTVVEGIDGLRQADPGLGAVNVVGFYTATDCGPRTFVWDPTCTADEDGCAIVKSSGTEDGRWILASDSRYMPCSWYGISAGSEEANIAAFLTYPETVGQWGIRLPPVPRFKKGEYTITTGTLVSPKALSFDTGATFSFASFDCLAAEISAWDGYVADFSFSGSDVTAHSGWFRSVQAWWHCGAHTMVFDSVNHFATTALTTTPALSGRVLLGNSRVPTSYSAGIYIQLTDCTVLGRKIFSPSQDYLRMGSMRFTTDWFTSSAPGQYDFGKVSQGHHLEVTTLSGNTLDFGDFRNANVYYKARLANGDTEFDGHGATYSSFTTNTQFEKISNCDVPSMNDSKCQSWNNVTVDGGLEFLATGPGNVTMKGCDFFLYGDLPQRIQSISIEGSNVRSGGKWRTSDSIITVSDSTWGATCELGDDAKTSRALAKPLSFDHCTLSMGGNYIWTNNLSMSNCTSNAHVYLVPYADSGAYFMTGYFQGNRFVQGALIECSVKDLPSESEVYHVLASLTFKDNRFEQEDTRGIVMPWLTQDFDTSRPFLAPGSTSASLYRNNTGNCPAEKPTRLFSASEMAAADGVHYLPPATYRQRVWDLNPQAYWYPGLMGIQFEPGSDSWNRINGRDARAHYGALMHIARVIQSDAENDQFGVVHAWETNDGFDPSVDVFYF